jgi:hypothetical protein
MLMSECPDILRKRLKIEPVSYLPYEDNVNQTIDMKPSQSKRSYNEYMSADCSKKVRLLQNSEHNIDILSYMPLYRSLS